MDGIRRVKFDSGTVGPSQDSYSEALGKDVCKAEKQKQKEKKKNQFERNGDKSLVASEPTLKVTLGPLSTRPLLENQTAAASARWSGGGPYVQ